MDTKKIIGLCEQILSTADKVVSVGAAAAQINGAQLGGIQRAARLIVLEVNKPKPKLEPELEPEEVAKDG